MRVIAVNVAVSFAEKLTDDEKETLLLKTFEALAGSVIAIQSKVVLSQIIFQLTSPGGYDVK